MNLPENLKYTKEHVWVSKNQDEVTVGITDFAQSELGEIVFVELPEVGKTYSAGDVLCVAESTKAASDVYSAITGEVVSVNDELEDNPNFVNEDPYGKGWLVKLKNVDEASLKDLISNKDYEAHITK